MHAYGQHIYVLKHFVYVEYECDFVSTSDHVPQNLSQVGLV